MIEHGSARRLGAQVAVVPAREQIDGAHQDGVGEQAPEGDGDPGPSSGPGRSMTTEQEEDGDHDDRVADEKEQELGRGKRSGEIRSEHGLQSSSQTPVSDQNERHFSGPEETEGAEQEGDVAERQRQILIELETVAQLQHPERDRQTGKKEASGSVDRVGPAVVAAGPKSQRRSQGYDDQRDQVVEAEKDKGVFHSESLRQGSCRFTLSGAGNDERKRGGTMRWQGRRESENVIDQTGGGGGGGGRGRLIGGGGVGTVVVVGLLFFMGYSPLQILDVVTGGGGRQTSAPARQSGPSTADPDQKQFVSVVLADTEEVWSELFAQRGMTYQDPRLVLFDGSVDSACGMADAAVGPFYCPPDQNLYLDLSFFGQLAGELKAPGDFAQAYVIGHEVGHHVQNLTGVLPKVNQAKAGMSKEEANALQVRVELQADYYAGVWAHHAQRRFQILEPGDIEEALRAASSIGDDTLQRKSRGYVVPDSFTHGTSEQRTRWFKRGFERGDWQGGDTFGARSL